VSRPVVAAPPRDLVAPLGLAGLAALGTVYVAAVDPNHAGHYPTCPFLYLTGYACPFCGSLRAVHDLVTGHPAAALHRNPLTVAFLPVVLVFWLLWLRQEITGRPMPAAPKWALWGLLGLWMVFWLVRNLPGFGWLGP
jgi:hypothetical protein